MLTVSRKSERCLGLCVCDIFDSFWLWLQKAFDLVLFMAVAQKYSYTILFRVRDIEIIGFENCRCVFMTDMWVTAALGADIKIVYDVQDKSNLL